jgi:hypothetical protein
MAEILVGEHAYPVRLEVTEDISLSATPSTILVENEPGGRAKRRVVYENTGNVPVTVGRLGALPLDEQLAECRTMRGMLADFGDKAETFDQWLTAYLRSGKKQLEKSGLLWVDAEKGPVTIQPGETAAVDLMIRMPDTLERSTRYYAIGFVYDVDLKFVIGPTGATPTAAPHRKAQPRRRRGEANELPPAQ